MMLFFYLSITVMFVNACELQKTCSACITYTESCVWCASETISGPRCISKSSMPENWCPGEIKDPQSSKIDIPHQNTTEYVQMKPKRIDMRLRPRQSVHFDFSYTAAEQYPVDLYFLFDASMASDYWEKHIEQTDELIQRIRNITNNCFVGFGTFTNKNALPFTSIKNKSLSYSFKHGFTLSRDIEDFTNTLKDVKIVKPPFIDSLNGGFDALAQVITCENIGWRKISRKIVVFFSDKLYHAAGDGMAAGIVNPYDGRCHTENGTYTKELEMDYPSTYMINKLASEQKVTIIFVITTGKNFYNPLAKIINGALVIFATVTSSREETIASKFQSTYENITKEIKLDINVNPEYKNKINVVIKSDCDPSQCKVKLNTEQKFTGTITVLENFEAKDIKVDISLNGIRETLTLGIKLINECDCAAGNNDLCNGGGKRKCGICECDPNRSGLNCECSSNNVDAYDNKTNCFMLKSKIECSGRGSCICGACRCREQRYRGLYCECDDELCPKDKNGRLCGRGQCRCGECYCEPGWIKNSQMTCNCEDSKVRCQTGDHECSSYGQCECNECKCPTTICDWDARNSQGPLCNPLPCDGCHERQCRLLETYALGRNDGSSTCGKRVNITSVLILENGTSWMLCPNIRSNVGCYTNFLYRYDDDKYGVHLIVQSKYDCVESAYIYGGTCLGVLIFIGILTLVGWKVLNTYRDRKEYKRFQKRYKESIRRGKEKENPLYNMHHTTTYDPMQEKTNINHE